MSSYKPPRGRNPTAALPAGDTLKGSEPFYVGAVPRYVYALSLTSVSIPSDIEERIERLLDKIATRQDDDHERYQVIAYASALEKEADGRLLSLVVDLIFRTLHKYDSRLKVAYTYADLCEILAQEILPNVSDEATRDISGKPIKGSSLLRKYFTNRCYEQMNAVWSARQKALALSAEGSEDSDRAAEVLSDATRQWTTLASFVGRLYQDGLLVDQKIIHLFLEKLLSGLSPTIAEARAASELVNYAIEKDTSGAKEQMDAHHLRMYKIANNDGIDPQVKFSFKTWVSPWQLSNGETLRFDQPNSRATKSDGPGYTNQMADVRDFVVAIGSVGGSPKDTTSPSSTPISDLADDKFEITPTTPLDIVIAFFKKVSNLKDYTSELDRAQYSSEPVATGGFSEVYRATIRKDTHVAVKCVWKSSVTGDNKIVKRTARELDVWSQLRHENILELLGLALFKGRLAMVSDWMELGSIVMLVNDRPSMDRYKPCAEVVGAVVYLHGLKIVHGDLKGANILVSYDGKPKLADFGLTIMHKTRLKLSETDPSGGTLRWMAPEMFTPVGRRSLEADVYALGMTMLEIFTGKEPFPEIQNSWVVQIAVLQDRQIPNRPQYLASPSQRNDTFWTSMKKCWVYEPGNRATAADVEEMVVSAQKSTDPNN